jgi:hypothetical protein
MTALLASELVLARPQQDHALRVSRPGGHSGNHPLLIGRNEELEVLTAIVDAEAGTGAALVLRGEPGLERRHCSKRCHNGPLSAA